MRSGPYLELTLDKPELLVRGSFDEASASLLSGRLVVHVNEPIRVRSLRLVFSGRVDTTLNQNIVPSGVARDEHREIVRREWVFLEPQRPPVTWAQSKTFRFDFLLAGDNPETIVTALGRVQYQLQATLERTAFHANLTASQEIPVKRGPVSGAPWALALMESIETTGEWNRQLEYRVSVPSRSLKDGEVFTTRFELEPRIKGMKLVAVGVLIKEYTRYYSSSGDPLHRFSRVVARNENYIGPTGCCGVAPRMAADCMDLVDATSVQIPLSVPEAYGAIQYDVLTDLIEVRHRIKFLIKVRDTNMLIHSIFIAVPVSIMPVSARDESSILPRYEPSLAGPGCGTVLMRSNTLPPAYDAVVRRRSSRPHPSNRDASDAGDTPAAASSPSDVVGPGTLVGGFPGPLHRSGSQFYLASPDSTPPLQPTGAASQTSSSDNALSSSSSETVHDPPLSLPQAAIDQEQLRLSPVNTTDTANDTLEDHKCLRSGGTGRRASTSSKQTSLHDLLAGAKISADKVRSIFHSRASSTSSATHHRHRHTHSHSHGHSHSRNNSREDNAPDCEDLNKQRPISYCSPSTPPPPSSARVRDLLCDQGSSGSVNPRSSSATPSTSTAATAHQSSDYNRDGLYNSQDPLLGASPGGGGSNRYLLNIPDSLGRDNLQTSRMPYPARAVIKPPPEALLRDHKQSPSPHPDVSLPNADGVRGPPPPSSSPALVFN
ncbi:hypothetical protein GGI11_003764 [Coemansia sp. RSA 2049]|nr:hypothetical protein GGI11_003764 [Coemansia sp. RSA 2049]